MGALRVPRVWGTTRRGVGAVRWLGLYKGQAPQAGYLGLMGFAAASVGVVTATGVVCGTSIEAAAAWDPAEFFGTDARRLMGHGLTLCLTILLLGLTVFGFSMVKAKVYPR